MTSEEDVDTFSISEVGQRGAMINSSCICINQDQVGRHIYAPDLIYTVCRMNYQIPQSSVLHFSLMTFLVAVFNACKALTIFFFCYPKDTYD